jgi:AcrR family transcriptional regulator
MLDIVKYTSFNICMPRAQLTDDELTAMRLRLSEAALDIYRKDGLEAVSFRRLADSVGLSHTLPYRYFDNKDALLARVRTDCFRRFEVFVRSAEQGLTDPLAKARAVIARYVEFVEQYPADYLLMFTMHQPPPDQYPELLAARRSLFEHAVDVIREGVASGQLAGDARQLAHIVWVSVHGLTSLHVANQLVHGLKLHQLVAPVIDRVLGLAAAAPGAAATSSKVRAVVTRTR